MQRIVLDSETDWQGWRNATRALVLAGVPPEDVRWSVRTHPDDAGHELPEGTGSFNVPRALVAIAALAFQAREPERFALLYRLVSRANAGEKLLEQTDDPELRRAQGLAYAVRAEAHKMRTMLRFLPVEDDRYLGWYVPAHHVLEANAQLIARRFPESDVLHPHAGRQRALAGRRAALRRRPRRMSPTTRRWTHGGQRITPSCCASARIGTSVPEAEALDEAPRPPDRPPIGPVVLPQHADPQLLDATHEAGDCRRCPLYEPATQTVFGEGPADAPAHVRRRATRRPGRHHRPALRRAGRPDHGPRDGGSRHRPPHHLHHQRGEALQIHPARQAAHPSNSGGAGDPGLPLLAGRRARAVAAEAAGADGRHRGACGDRAGR